MTFEPQQIMKVDFGFRISEYGYLIVFPQSEIRNKKQSQELGNHYAKGSNTITGY